MKNQIVQGSAVTLTIQLFDSTTKKPYNLAGFESGTAFFAPLDTTLDPIQVSVSLVSSDLGTLSCDLSAATTLTMAVGDNQEFQVNFIQSSLQRIALFENGYSVVAPPFSS